MKPIYRKILISCGVVVLGMFTSLYFVVSHTHLLDYLERCPPRLRQASVDAKRLTERLPTHTFDEDLTNEMPIHVRFGDGQIGELRRPEDRFGLEFAFSDDEVVNAWTYYDYGFFELVSIGEDSILRVYTTSGLFHTDRRLSWTDLLNRTTGECRLTEEEWENQLASSRLRGNQEEP